ncbi:hypothetical protein BS17DRAFT_777175 [Gyrodon lividus]|nr:hypothetical protein BS17DRAFT_777175 [Gyrodon lividus]
MYTPVQVQAAATAEVAAQGNNQPIQNSQSTPLVKKQTPFSSHLPSSAQMDLPALPPQPFHEVADAREERHMYDPFVATIANWIPGFQAVNTNASLATSAVSDFHLKPDVSIFREGFIHNNRPDFSAMEMCIEFKKDRSGAPFVDPPKDTRQATIDIDQGSFEPDTKIANEARGQLIAYAVAHHGEQFRHFSFSVIIVKDHARFLRWDVSGVVVSAQFNYQTNPVIMAEFFWRFSRLTDEQRGHDRSVRPANLQPDLDQRVRDKLGVESTDTPLFKYDVPGLIGQGHCYGPRPPYPARSLVGRSTRSLTVFYQPIKRDGEQHAEQEDEERIEQEQLVDRNVEQAHQDVHQELKQDGDRDNRWAAERVIYLKDCWRFLSETHDIQPEHEIYESLNHHNTPNIPTLVRGGDVAGHGSTTVAHQLTGAPWLCVKPKLTSFVHYRLALGDVGRPLTSFTCTKQLVRGVLGAMEAHWHAYHVARILHRDVSAGNVIVTDQGKGLLIDWELAKKVGEIGNRRRNRTGTWQFMSAALLQDVGKLHTLVDDLESFLHVLGWATIRFVPTSDAYLAEQRTADLRRIFDDADFKKEGAMVGGSAKADALRGGGYPPAKFQLKQPSPLHTLLETLSSPFISLYAKKPPTAGDRAKVEQRSTAEADEDVILLWSSIVRYDRDMKRLESSTWFINTIENALQQEGWPEDDKADPNLLLHSSSDLTEKQRLLKTDRMQSNHSQWESSKCVSTGSGSLKRQASPSPPPEGRTKRRRDTPSVET